MAEVRLGRQRSPERAEGPHMVPYLRAANVKDGYLDLSDVKEMDFTPAEQSVYSLKPGDVLVTEGAGSLAAVGASAVWDGEIQGAVCFQNTLLRLRPRAGNDARYLMWWARHAYGSGLFASVAAGANIYHLGADTVREMPVIIPDPQLQQAIANYLDAETRQIDQLVELRERQLGELEARRAAVVVSWILNGENGDMPRAESSGRSTATFPAGWRRTRLKFLCEPPQPGDWGVDVAGGGGVAVVRAADFNRIHWLVDPSDLPTREIDLGSFAHRKLEPGDLVIEKSGGGADQPVGAVVSYDLEMPAVPSNFAARLRPVAGVDPRFLCYVFAASYAIGLNQRSIKQTTGIQNLDLGAYLSESWSVPGYSEQVRIRRTIDAELAGQDALNIHLRRQTDLLLERRHALITAAVTGRLAVPEVAA